MKDADGKPIGIVIIARDITERKRAEEELRDRAATMRALLNAPIETAILVDASGTILALNETAAQVFGKSTDELVGLCAYDLLPPAVAEFRKAQADKVFRSGTPVRFEDKREGRFIDNSFYPVLDEGGKVVRIAIFARDITHRKQAEERIRSYQERLRSLASQLSLAEEEERRRIALALHDRIGQTLAISKIKLGAMQELASSPDLAEPLDEIRELIEEIIRDTRSLTFELSSPILYELGLEAAVEWLAEQIEDQHDILSFFEDDEQPKPLHDDIRITLFQAVRELLVNVAKHAQAHNVKVSMGRDDGHIRITVEDDGIGFDFLSIGSRWSRTEGIGLFSIHERLVSLGGHLEVESEPGHGTRVTLVAPLSSD
jgi:PAS domain S-box-containing protein